MIKIDKIIPTYYTSMKQVIVQCVNLDVNAWSKISQSIIFHHFINLRKKFWAFFRPLFSVFWS